MRFITIHLLSSTLASGDESAMKSWRTSENAVNAKSNFIEIVKGEVQLRRIHLPGTPVNKRWFSFALIVTRRGAGLRSLLGSPLSSRAR
jgi:hypothetical protein